LDAYLEKDENAKVACETLVTKNLVVVSGEINSKEKIDVEKVVRETIKEIGYTYENNGFKWDEVEIINKLHKQSNDINIGVDLDNGETGSGDQGIMFGYAINESENYMPLTMDLSNIILKELKKLKENDSWVFENLRPDSKSQVSILYDENNKPQKIDTILISTQHSENVSLDEIKYFIKNTLIPNVIEKHGYKDLYKDYKLLVNPTGRFVTGGPEGDTGLTGRKIVVDQYGGRCPVGGGAFSGKDGSKTDRSAAYAARWIAKNVVASGIAEECLIQLSYAIGVPEPVSIYVETYGTGKIDDKIIEDFIKNNYKLTPKWISDKLDLKKPIYKKTASYGHFGRNEFNWEKLNLVEDFKKLL
jgi:S-adenosylmethionine synthetase